MATSDILVCGKCHSVFHFIDLFKEHKANNCKRLSAFKECVSLFLSISILLWITRNYYNVSFFYNFFREKLVPKFGLIFFGSKLNLLIISKVRMRMSGSFISNGWVWMIVFVNPGLLQEEQFNHSRR